MPLILNFHNAIDELCLWLKSEFSALQISGKFLVWLLVDDSVVFSRLSSIYFFFSPTWLSILLFLKNTYMNMSQKEWLRAKARALLWL